MYYLGRGIRKRGVIRVRYEEHPWITRFEVDGIEPLPLSPTALKVIRENEMIIGYINTHGRMTRVQIQERCGCGRRHAYTLLHMLMDEGYVMAAGSGRGIYYTRKK